MFIKRINKIYAPTNIKANNARTNKLNLNQQELNADNSFYSFKVFTITCDPHGVLIAMYSQQRDAIYLVSIVTLLEYIDKYRSQFAEDSQYSFKSPLKPELIIYNPRPSLNIFQIKFSHRVQNTQFICVVYYNGIIDVYSVVTGKKMDGVDIMQKSMQMGEQISPIYNVNVIGHSIFISTYDGKMMCYEGHQLTKCTKNQDQWIRLCYTNVNNNLNLEQQQDTQVAQKQQEETKAQKKYPLYYDKNKNLKIGSHFMNSNYYLKLLKRKEYEKQKKQAAQKQKKSLSEKQLQSESYNQYLKLQMQKIPISGDNKPYTLTFCQRYIVYHVPVNLIYERMFISSSFYVIRSKISLWRFVKNMFFPTFPHINHFWGLQVKRNKNESEKKILEKKKLCQKFISFCKKNRFLIVAVLGNYDVQQNGEKLKYSQQSISEKVITIIRIWMKNYIYYSQILCKLKDIKHKVIQIHWVGPNMLLYTDQNGNVYYMQISPQLLIK